ncbi:MAG: outer membrane protein assembly factor BamA [Desulfonauticus sp.]|nr:outer membrane protein assembly factor BamA [Desulfonauticus sp.]
MKIKCIQLKFLTLISGFILSFLVLPQLCLAKKITIAVFPFEINADQNLSYLKKDLPALIKSRLEKKGFKVIDLKTVDNLLEKENINYLDIDTVKDLSLLLNASYGLYGSFNKVGQTISIDTRLVDAYGTQSPKAFFVVKKGLINLLPAVDELTKNIKLELLKKEKIVSIEVEGNKILDKEVILLHLHTQKGDIFDAKKLNQDLKSLYKLGYFDDIRFLVQDTPEGKKIIIKVKEKPLIKAISVEGAKAISEDDILSTISTKTGTVLNPSILAEDLEKIRALYKKKGYYKVQVSYKIETVDNKQARLIFKIKEGPKLYIKKITIKGAKQIDPDELKDQLALGERGFFSWITGSGILKEELLDRDAAALEAYYANRGFINARVGKPEVKFKNDGIYITFNVVEGNRYRVGGVKFAGDIIFPEKDLLNIIQMDEYAKEHKYFDRSVLRKDLQAIADYYTNYGYAFADCDVQIKTDPKKQLVFITYIPSKGQKVYIRRVLIEGNEYTRDNVIRREMRLADGDLFSGKKLKRSNVRLNKLDYFDTVDIQTVPTNNPAQMDLIVKVKEKPTGMLTAGAGYSSYEKLFFTASVQERNLFGKGYSISLSGSFSGKSTSYVASFWNPHYQDSKLGVGLSVYRQKDDFFNYKKKTIGSKFNFAYPLGEYTNLYWSYKIEQYTITDVDTDADQTIKDMEGNNWASVFTIGATRDTTDRLLNPSKGTKNTLTLEYAGGLLGGNDNFIKTIYDFSWYKPVFKNLTFHWHYRLGYLTKNGDEPLPSFERFYLGGINSIRGYPGREIAPKYDNGDYKGGNKEFFTNYELLFPINKELQILGLFFFDAGNTWDEDHDVDFKLYRSVGTGIRWYSPLGPLRLEFGYALDKLDGERPKKLEFSIGQFY